MNFTKCWVLVQKDEIWRTEGYRKASSTIHRIRNIQNTFFDIRFIKSVDSCLAWICELVPFEKVSCEKVSRKKFPRKSAPPGVSRKEFPRNSSLAKKFSGEIVPRGKSYVQNVCWGKGTFSSGNYFDGELLAMELFRGNSFEGTFSQGTFSKGPITGYGLVYRIGNRHDPSSQMAERHWAFFVHWLIQLQMDHQALCSSNCLDHLKEKN